MKPVHRADDASGKLHRPIAAAHVLEFVDDCAADVGVAPAGGIDRQHDRGARKAARERRRNPFVKQNVDRTAHTSLRRQGSEERLALRPSHASAAKLVKTP